MVSPQDDIMRIFGGNRLFAILASFESHPEGDPLIESKQLMRNITTIQKQVEGRNFDIRKHILEYDDVLNQHRLAIYARRNRILEGEDIHAEVVDMVKHEARRLVEMASIKLEKTSSFSHERDPEVIIRLVDEINSFADQPIADVEHFRDNDTEE